jgi:hypothetical protein
LFDLFITGHCVRSCLPNVQILAAYLMEEREVEKTLSLFGRLSLSRSMTQPLEVEAAADEPLQPAGPLS